MTSTQPAPTRTSDDADRSSGLDRRRTTLQRRDASAVTAAASVATLERQLEKTAAQIRQDHAALDAARHTVASLKTSIADAEKRTRTLRTARKKAHGAATKATRRAQKAEAKYDQAVLAEIIAKQKQTDLSQHPKIADTEGTARPGANPAAAATGTSAKTARPQSDTTTRPRATRPAPR